MRSVGELADASAVEEFIMRLADQGHRRFLHLAGDYAHTSARRRRDAYRHAIERLGLESYGVIDCDWLAQHAREAILGLPDESGVTAVIAANDVLAVGAISGAYLRGWRVPGDLSVTGWDNNPVAAAMTPAVTTVNIDYQSLGRRAVSRLLATLRGEEAVAGHDPISTVIWRESTGPVHVPGH